MNTSTRSFPRRRGWLLVLLLAAVAGGIVIHQRDAAQSGPQSPANSAANAPVPVSMQPAVRRDLPIWLQAIGTVQPLASVNVKVRADGELLKVLFQEGQMVQAGALLAQIDPRTYQASLDQALASKTRDQAQLASTRIDLERATKLAAAGAGPTQAVDTLRAQLAIQQATIQADQASVDAARIQLSFTEIRAPFTGRSGRRLVDAGAIVHAADTTGLVTITQMDPISILFAVPQDDLSMVLDESAKQPLQVVALTRDGSRQIATGQLAFVDNQVSSGNGQIQLKANFANPRNALWPGALVSVRLLVRTEANATLVPASAVQRSQQGEYVYVVDSDHKVAPRPVQTGVVADGMQWIRAGVAPGEIVVTSGQFRLARGVTVSALPGGAATSTTKAAGAGTARGRS